MFLQIELHYVSANRARMKTGKAQGKQQFKILIGAAFEESIEEE